MLTKLGGLLFALGLAGLVYFGLFFRPKALEEPASTRLGRLRLPNAHFPEQVADRVVGILVGVGLLISGTILVSRRESEGS